MSTEKPIKYSLKLTINGHKISSVLIGRHYVVKHGKYMNDELILRQTPFQGMAVQRLIMESSLGGNQWRAYGPRGLNAGGAIGITLFIDVRDTSVAVRSELARCLAANITGRPRVARVVADACPAA